MAAPGPLSIRGTRESGQDVRTSNVTAVLAVANVVKSSLGPVGLDKMLVDDIGDVCITNDGATILKMLEVEHPAAKILVELAGLQDAEVGDGTTSVVILAAELLKRAHDLVKNKIHATSVIAGYRMAMKEAVKFVQDSMAIGTESLGEATLLQCAKTAMSSKLVGAQEDFFARMVVDAISSVRMITELGDVRYPVKAINVLKAHGRSAMESELVKGYALNMGRAAQGMPLRVAPARVACLDFNLQKHRMHMGIQVQVSDPKALERIRQEEMEISMRRIRKIVDAGANVVLTTKGIDDFCLKAFVEAGCIACRRVPKVRALSAPAACAWVLAAKWARARLGVHACECTRGGRAASCIACVPALRPLASRGRDGRAGRHEADRTRDRRDRRCEPCR